MSVDNYNFSNRSQNKMNILKKSIEIRQSSWLTLFFILVDPCYNYLRTYCFNIPNPLLFAKSFQVIFHLPQVDLLHVVSHPVYGKREALKGNYRTFTRGIEAIGRVISTLTDGSHTRA